MPATRTCKEFSITVRPGDPDGVRKYHNDYLKWLEDVGTSHYVVAYEQKGDLSTEHFQCAVVFNEEHRSDNLKKTLVGLLGHSWSDAQKRVAVCVNKNRENNDIRLLAGGYCLKQDVAPFIKGWTLDELMPFVDQYEELKEKSLLRNITRENIINILQTWHDEYANNKDPDVRDRFERLSPTKKLQYMYKYGIAQGADLQKYSNPNWLNYLCSNFDVLFERVSADRLMKELSEAPV